MTYTIKMYGIEITKCVANHSMSIDDVLEVSGVDIDEELSKHGVDEWNYEDIELVIE